MTEAAVREWVADAARTFKGAVAAARRTAVADKRPLLVTAATPAPDVDLLRVFDAGQCAAERVLWLRSQEPFGLAGVGAAWSFVADGPGRFGRADAAWRRIVGDAAGDGKPIALYGFAFADETSGWSGYPAGLITVPRITIHQTARGTRAVLAAVVTPESSSPAECDETLACARTVSAALAAPADRAASSAAPRPLRVVEEFPAAAQWKDAVRETANAVRSGTLRKAVLARGVRVRCGRLNAAVVLHSLRTSYPDCTIFAVGRGPQCFLGATPERLVRLKGIDVAVDALAGSAPRGRSDLDDRALAASLLGSAKDRIEHALVVDALRETLSGISAVEPVVRDPQVLTVRNTHHLYTPLRAVLRWRLSVLDIARRLHPTPAVGGVPHSEALRWIRRHEGWDRGWYAGPIGWIDSAGDGEAAVAIRSGLLDGDEATLFAGCGIVADSDPDLEFAESRWKLRPLISALSHASRRPDGLAADPRSDRDHSFGG